MSKRTTICIAIAAVCLLCAAWLVSRTRGNSFAAYFYDLQEARLYVAPVGTLPPATAPSGGEGVLAIVFACADCDDPEDRRIAYLQTYTDEYRQALEAGGEIPEMVTFAGQRYRAVDDATWYPDGPEAAAIIAAAKRRCTGGKPIRCRP